jgi:hypothetical protein
LQTETDFIILKIVYTHTPAKQDKKEKTRIVTDRIKIIVIKNKEEP